MTAHVISFDEIYAPRRVELSYGIVVRLRAWLGRVHAPHVRIPAAVVVFIGDVGRVVARVFDRQIFTDRLSRNTAHDVDAELQAFAVHVIGKMLEPRPVRRRGKAVDGGKQAAILIHRKLGTWSVIVALRIGLVPLDVDDDVLPSVAGEI